MTAIIGGPPKKRRKRRRDPRGRKPVTETIRLNYVNQGKAVRFSISSDLVEQLKKAHDAMFRAYYMNSLAQADYDPFAAIRIQFMRFDDITMPAVLIRIEPPSFDPKGNQLWKAKTGQRFYVQTRAKMLGLRDGMDSVRVEYLFEPSTPKLLGGGIFVIFPDEYMIYEGKKNRAALRRSKAEAA